MSRRSLPFRRTPEPGGWAATVELAPCSDDSEAMRRVLRQARDSGAATRITLRAGVTYRWADVREGGLPPILIDGPDATVRLGDRSRAGAALALSGAGFDVRLGQLVGDGAGRRPTRAAPLLDLRPWSPSRQAGRVRTGTCSVRIGRVADVGGPGLNIENAVEVRTNRSGQGVPQWRRNVCFERVRIEGGELQSVRGDGIRVRGGHGDVLVRGVRFVDCHLGSLKGGPKSVGFSAATGQAVDRAGVVRFEDLVIENGGGIFGQWGERFEVRRVACRRLFQKADGTPTASAGNAVKVDDLGPGGELVVEDLTSTDAAAGYLVNLEETTSVVERARLSRVSGDTPLRLTADGSQARPCRVVFDAVRAVGDPDRARCQIDVPEAELYGCDLTHVSVGARVRRLSGRGNTWRGGAQVRGRVLLDDTEAGSIDLYAGADGSTFDGLQIRGGEAQNGIRIWADGVTLRDFEIDGPALLAAVRVLGDGARRLTLQDGSVRAHGKTSNLPQINLGGVREVDIHNVRSLGGGQARISGGAPGVRGRISDTLGLRVDGAVASSRAVSVDDVYVRDDRGRRTRALPDRSARE